MPQTDFEKGKFVGSLPATLVLAADIPPVAPTILNNILTI